MYRLLFAISLLGIGISTPANAQNADSTLVKDKTLKQVTVAGTKRQVVYRLDRKKIDAQQILSAAGGTAVDILATLPSVQVDAEGGVTFRGSSNFLVYIDGKQSPLEGAAALAQIPASMIQDIEILTTPGAKYRTDGDVGIINITTLKGRGSGLSGQLNGSGTTLGGWGGDGRLDYQRGNNRFWGSMQANRYRGVSDFNQQKTTLVDDFTTTSLSDGQRFRTERAYLGTVGWQHAMGQKHVLNVDLQSGETKNRRGGDMDYRETRYQGDNLLHDNQYDAHDRYSLTKHLVQLSADYTWKINERGDQLSLQSRNRYDWYSLEYTESNLFDTHGVRFEGTRGYEKEHHWDCDERLDYKLQYRPTGTLEAGYQYITYSEIGGYNIKYWDRPAQQFEWQDDLHAPFDYRRQTNSLYAMATDRFGSLQVDAGLRMDRIHDQMDITVANASRNIHRTEFYPSAHAAYATQRGTFALGYARRTNRPGIWKLEPYITYEDYYTKKIGNPDLNPEYIHSLELSYRKTFNGRHSLAVTGYQRWRTDVVDEIRVAYEPGVTLDSIINAGDRIDRGVELSLALKPWSWWNTTLNADMQNYRFTSHYEGCSDNDGLTYALGWINQFTLAQHTHMQFDGHLIGPHMLTQGHEKSYCYFDLALKQNFLGGKLSAALVAHDVFHTARYRNWRNTSTLSSHTRVTPVYPNISLSISYRFNSQPKEKDNSGAINKDAIFEGKEF